MSFTFWNNWIVWELVRKDKSLLGSECLNVQKRCQHRIMRKGVCIQSYNIQMVESWCRIQGKLFKYEMNDIIWSCQQNFVLRLFKLPMSILINKMADIEVKWIQNINMRDHFISQKLIRSVMERRSTTFWYQRFKILLVLTATYGSSRVEQHLTCLTPLNKLFGKLSLKNWYPDELTWIYLHVTTWHQWRYQIDLI